RALDRNTDLISYDFEASTATHVSGHCWKITLPVEFTPGDHDFRGRTSRLQLYQGERELGPAFSLPRLIAEVGNGAYRHRGEELYFSTFGNVDPKSIATRLKLKSTAKSGNFLERARILESKIDELSRGID